MRHRNAAIRKYRKKLSHNKLLPTTLKIVGQDRHGQKLYKDSEGHTISGDNKITIDIGERHPHTLVQVLDPQYPIYREFVGQGGPRWKVTYPPIQREPTENNIPIGFLIHEQAVITTMPRD